MSVNMDNEMTTDYSDFRYQVGNVSLQGDASGGKLNTGGHAEYEPLTGRGGLDVNEIAELVHLETIAYVEPESDTGDQDVASFTEFRGVVGLNLPPTQEAEISNRPERGQATVYDENDGTGQLSVKGDSDDRILQPFVVASSPPFDDESNGPGGSYTGNVFHAKKSFRQIMGRGPVLDSNDSLTVNARIVREDSVLNEGGNVRFLAVWDTAEVEDSGRAFSVPR